MSINDRIRKIEQKTGTEGEQVAEIIVYIVNKHRPINEADEPLPEQDIQYISPENFDLKKAVCIATSQQDNEPEYMEILRTAETGTPVLKEVTGIVKQFTTITPEQAREYMQAWNIPEADIDQEFSITGG